MGKTRRHAFIHRLRDWLYNERVGVVDCWLERRQTDGERSEFAIVEFMDGTTLERNVTNMSDLQTAAMILTIVDSRAV